MVRELYVDIFNNIRLREYGIGTKSSKEVLLCYLRYREDVVCIVRAGIYVDVAYNKKTTVDNY